MTVEKADCYAHSLEDSPVTQWQKLEEHLIGTAERASRMAREFSCGDRAYLTGLWHDLGKFSPEFQQYIRETGDIEAHIEGSASKRVDHSTAGAMWAIENLKITGRILAYPIAGHHAGFPDYESDQYGNASLSQRLRHAELLDAARCQLNVFGL